MNFVYLHGFQSSPQSLKAAQLKAYLSAHMSDSDRLYVPDLNMPPVQVIQKLDQLLCQLDHVGLIGSSFGGFYATQLVAKHACPAVLINPAVRPWQLFAKLFKEHSLPFQISSTWALTEQDLEQLEQMAQPFALQADKLLVLLQQGDEILNYLEAFKYYTQPQAVATVMTQMGGNHAMEDFEQKIPLIVRFLTQSIV